MNFESLDIDHVRVLCPGRVLETNAFRNNDTVGAEVDTQLAINTKNSATSFANSALDLRFQKAEIRKEQPADRKRHQGDEACRRPKGY